MNIKENTYVKKFICEYNFISDKIKNIYEFKYKIGAINLSFRFKYKVEVSIISLNFWIRSAFDFVFKIYQAPKPEDNGLANVKWATKHKWVPN